MRSTWTDSRLDDLKAGVDSRLDDLNVRVSALGVEVREMRGEIGALQRTLIQVGIGLAGAMLVGFIGLIASLFIALL
jgi:hypothetical protein